MKTLPEVENMFARVHSIVAITKRSVVAADELKRLQICNGKTEGTALKLKQDVPTHWNSLFYMIERFPELREYIYPVLMKCPIAPEMLTREQIQVLEDCVLVLRLIENVITKISGKTYPTGSMAILIIRCMKNALNRCILVTKIGENMKMKIIVQEKFEGIEICKLLTMSTILDPRFKKINFQFAMTAVTAIADINKAMKSANSAPEISVAQTSKPPESSTGQSIWEFHDNLIVNNMQPNSDPSELHLELRQYLN
ncbi:zinc finger bed domain-containing protein 4-like protein [Lasius niger]|uniref:Zinc finger bed domain-containing protein 4-like protein n=2 Tax=Lasius TaxID=488720 RepID=A0A0J7KNL6_LASNI|nr:zinc finger bed domain-containing protein 4-like protein [Lasius niger]